MDENKIAQQLNTEIEKLKENDYTSYQSFYNQTSNHLYGIIWSNVRDQDIANSLLNELYTEIYSSIARELTDNSQFYTWAENKAHTLTTTYLSTHNIDGKQASNDNNRRAEGAAVAAALNAGMDMAGGALGSGMADGTIGAADMGLGSATGGAANIGMNSAAGGAANVGMGSATGGVANIGMGSSASGAANIGMGQAASGAANIGMGQAAGGAANAAAGAAKVGIGMGAKIALATVAAVAVIGIGIGTFVAVNSDKEKTTEATTEVTTEATTEMVSTDQETATEESTEVATDDTTEEVVEIDDTQARYTAYYNVVTSYMEQYPATVTYEWDNWRWSEIQGLSCVQLIDFNGDGEEQLVLTRYNGRDAGYCDIDIYDYQDETATLIAAYTTVDQYSQPSTTEAHVMFIRYADNTMILKVSDGENRIFYGYEDGAMQEVTKDDAEESKAYSYCMYYNSGNTLARDEEIKRIEDTLIIKHKTITELAKQAGDEAFVDSVSEPGYTIDEKKATTQANKYNEIYTITFGYYENPELSANGKTITLHDSLIGNMYVSYVDDTLMIPYNLKRTFRDVEYVILEYSWMRSLDECYFAENDLWIYLDKYDVITEDEYNSRVNALLNE